MRTITPYLEEIEKAQGLNAKNEILKKLLSIPEGEEYLRMVFNEDKYGVSTRSFEKVVGYDKEKDGSYEDAGMMVYKKIPETNINLFFFAVRTFVQDVKNLSGNEQLALLSRTKEFDRTQMKWIVRLFMKNLYCGVSRTSVNNCLVELGKKPIEKFEVQLCAKLTSIEEWTEFPCLVATKYDGLRCIAEKNGKEVTLTSRSGKNIAFVPEIVEAIRNLPWETITLDGEVMAQTFNDIQQRIGRKDNFQPVVGLHFRVFDVLNVEEEDFSKQPQIGRTKWIVQNIGTKFPYMATEEHKLCNTQDELIDYYDNICNMKGEGVVVKRLRNYYDYGSRDNWCKVKPISEATVKVAGFKFGTGKHKDVVGSLLYTDKSGNVTGKVGSGIKDEDRERLDKMAREGKLEGSLIEIKYAEITKNKSNSQKSLRFPRFRRLRIDIQEPDNLDNI